MGGHRAQGDALRAEMELKIRSLEDERRMLTAELEGTKRDYEHSAAQSTRDYETQLSHLQQLLSEAKRRADAAEEVSSKLAGEIEGMRRAEIEARDSEHHAKDNLNRRSMDFTSQVEARDREVERLQEQIEELSAELAHVEQSKDAAAYEYHARIARLGMQIPAKVLPVVLWP